MRVGVTGSSFRLFQFQWHPICKHRLAKFFTVLHFEVVLFAFHQHNWSKHEGNQFWLNLNFYLMSFNCITFIREQLFVEIGKVTQSAVYSKRKSVAHKFHNSFHFVEDIELRSINFYLKDLLKNFTIQNHNQIMFHVIQCASRINFWFHYC